ncbi:hypothetical protein [Fibrobacter succinogenes]|uniref:hypothetical protein n=1 Tax=Fibrobacter succinogenes TaxID=833 RepID=UPI0013D7ECE7|nr:hypothetical protein [Fibrobacter succinogenes]
MKTLAKIILASSLMTLAACSGKGSGESRIHDIPSDDVDNPTPHVIDDEGNSSSGLFACTDASGYYCAETTDQSYKSECDVTEGEQLLDKCPSGGVKCDIPIPNVTFYVYEGSEMTCDMLKLLMAMTDEGSDVEWEF